ncbi:MAG: LysM peptidoglycan-binding domain-containing protein [Desulfuromonadales bacterium]|nr:LysM peptidoglycan-binding domain-containing protein [Desulfuromonadales bacterium]
MTVCILLLLVSGTASAERAPFLYTVVKGDTLWDISARFISDPFYWPNIWRDNPHIENPHLIYPGQQLRVHDKHIEILPHGDTIPPVAVVAGVPDTHVEMPGEAWDRADEVQLVATYGGSRSFLGDDELDALGTLVDAKDSKVLISEHDEVFLQMRALDQVTPGDQYELIELGPEIVHPVSRQKIGNQTVKLGTVEITGLAEHVAVARVVHSAREILRGAKLRKAVTTPERIPLVPADRLLAGYVVSADQGKIALGQWDVIQIDLGAGDGLQVGNALNIVRDRSATRFAAERGRVPLPDLDLGDAVVVEVGPRFASALITRIGNVPIYRGDRVQTQLD